MENKSISDIIEAYLKEILGDSAQVEIRRSETIFFPLSNLYYYFCSAKNHILW